jgi:hypothetical protein
MRTKQIKVFTHAHNPIVNTIILSFVTSLSANAQLLILTAIRKKSTPWRKHFNRPDSNSHSWRKSLILVWTQLMSSFLISGILLLKGYSSGLLVLALFQITISRLDSKRLMKKTNSLEVCCPKYSTPANFKPNQSIKRKSSRKFSKKPKSSNKNNSRSSSITSRCNCSTKKFSSIPK